MSHVTKMPGLNIVSIEDTTTAARALGCELVKADTFCYFAGQTARCDYKIKVSGSRYEVGLKKAADGKGYDVLWDNWGSDGRRLVEVLGQNFSKLKVEYTCSASARMLARQGYSAKRVVVNGQTKLIATKR